MNGLVKTCRIILECAVARYKMLGVSGTLAWQVSLAVACSMFPRTESVTSPQRPCPFLTILRKILQGSEMMKRFLTLMTCFMLALVVNCGCSSQPATKTADRVETKPVSVSDEAKVKLAEADKLDGKEDHVVERCYSCALGMEGKPEFAVEVDGYTVRFCSEDCREHFASDPENVIASTKIPQVKK
jgi:YHS domain-containing protein